ncbi:MAG: VanW family protein [Peptococcales bacterium]|jgi:vancomycin resistance protein YoaR
MKNKLIYIIFLFFLIPIHGTNREPIFIDNVFIHGIDVSGLNRVEAERKIKPYLKKVFDQKVIIQHPEQKEIWITTYKEMGIGVNLEKALNEGLTLGNQGVIFKRWWERLKIKKDGFYVPLELEIREDLAIFEIERLTAEILQKPQNAKFKITSQNIVIIEPDISGVGIEVEKMISELKGNLKLQGPLSIKVVTKEIKADTTEEDLKKLNVHTLIGQFTTWFNPQQKSRSANIKLAAQALNDYLLAPKEEFSFNKIVGPRTKEAGYNDAPIILNKQFVDGLGGGVCQVSSTLYNVLIRSNLLIVERHPHSLPVGYVPKGMDAAVVYGLKDLRFMNNTKGHILFKTYVGQGSITIKLFGSKEEMQNIEVVSIVEKIFTPKIIIKNKEELAKGQVTVEQHGEEGYLVRVERIIKDMEENILVHEMLSRDYYPPVDKIILQATNY